MFLLLAIYAILFLMKKKKSGINPIQQQKCTVQNWEFFKRKNAIQFWWLYNDGHQQSNAYQTTSLYTITKQQIALLYVFVIVDAENSSASPERLGDLPTK